MIYRRPFLTIAAARRLGILRQVILFRQRHQTLRTHGLTRLFRIEFKRNIHIKRWRARRRHARIIWELTTARKDSHE